MRQGIDAGRCEIIIDRRGPFAHESCPLVARWVQMLHKKFHYIEDLETAGDCRGFALFALARKMNDHVIKSSPVTARYLEKLLINSAADAARDQKGRYQCYHCVYYHRAGERCENNHSPHGGTSLAPQSNPRWLNPRCWWFDGRGEILAFDESTAADHRNSDASNISKMHKSLDILKHRDFEAYAVIYEVYIENKSLRAIERESGRDRRTLTLTRDRGLERLHHIYEDLP